MNKNSCKYLRYVRGMDIYVCAKNECDPCKDYKNCKEYKEEKEDEKSI